MIVRFVVAVLSIAWAAYVVPLFRTILAHPLPQNIPHRREIYIGQGISGVFVSRGLIPVRQTNVIKVRNSANMDRPHPVS